MKESIGVQDFRKGGRRKRGETAKKEKGALGDAGYFHNCHNCGMVYFYICLHHQTGIHGQRLRTVKRRKAAIMPKRRKEEVLAYLEERYGEEFEIASYRGMSYAYDYVQMYAYPKGYSDEAHQFKIQGRLNGEGKMEYVDSYVMVKLSDDYAACVDEIIDEYFDDYKFYLEFDSEWITSNLPPDTKVEDLFKLSANVDYPLPRLFIYLKSSQKEYFTKNNIMNMCRKLAVWGYRGPINITDYDDDQYYEKKNNENKRECLEGE